MVARYSTVNLNRMSAAEAEAKSVRCTGIDCVQERIDIAVQLPSRPCRCMHRAGPFPEIKTQVPHKPQLNENRNQRNKVDSIDL